MKRLTSGQLSELGIHNNHEFCRGSFYLYFIPHSRCTMSSFGWHLVVPSRNVSTENWQSFFEDKGRSSPDDMRERLEPELRRLGLKWPEGGWVRNLGDWVPRDYCEKRMAELVIDYKAVRALKEKPGERGRG